jgi:quercetin 2,3-dioxygenase
LISLRKSEDRGHFDHGWLNTRHTFSFADYFDPRHMGFRTLRVINEDIVSPGEGFPTHPHRDMEIISYVISGGLQHRDSMGTGSIIRPGEVQRLSAGTGVQHSEYNASKTEPVHFLQIWIVPEVKGLPPGYEQRKLDDMPAPDGLRLIASRDGQHGSVTVHQDVRLFQGTLPAGGRLEHQLNPRRFAWVQLIGGRLLLNDLRLKAGDGAAVMEEETLQFAAAEPSELLLFDLA